MEKSKLAGDTNTSSTFVKEGLFQGRQAAHSLVASLRDLIARESKSFVLKPCLAILMIGKDSSSAHFVRRKQELAAELGIQTKVVHLASDSCDMGAVLSILESWNRDRFVHGILVQMPVPSFLDSLVIRSAIDVSKDVDGMHPWNFAMTSNLCCTIHEQSGELDPARQLTYTPAVVRAIILVINNLLSANELLGLKMLIINDSFLIGRPLSNMMLNAGCVVTVSHIHTKNLEAQVRDADVVVTATGKPGLVNLSWLKAGAIAIDAGSNYHQGCVKGDVDYCEGRDNLANRILTPVPGGVGPLTVAVLMHNVIMACREQNHGRMIAKAWSRKEDKMPELETYKIGKDFQLVKYSF